MKTLDEFIDEWNGKWVDYDHVNGPQCTDLMRQSEKEIEGFEPYVAIPTTGRAKDIFNNFKTNKYYTKVINTPTGVPPKGAIIFWGTYLGVTGLAGHVARFCQGDASRFIAFGQNYGNPNFCRYQNYNYHGVLGWLVPTK